VDPRVLGLQAWTSMPGCFIILFPAYILLFWGVCVCVTGD
jgi:hypothetical protein